MLVVAIIGILLTIAIPVYKDFTVRTKVAELIAAAGPLKSAVTEKALQDAALAAAGVGATVTTSGKVTGGNVSDEGVISISGDSTATSIGTAVTIVLTPTLGAGGKVLWACSTAPAAFRIVPAECRH